MTEPVRDPVHRARYAFEPDGDDLLVDAWIEPGGGLPAHSHPNQEERWWVVSGQIRIQVGPVSRVVGPTDGEILVPAGTKHALASVRDADAHLRCRATPALDLQAFLEESAQAARDGLFMRGGIPRNLRGARWAAAFLQRHRENVVMAFPPRFAQSAMIAAFGRQPPAGVSRG